MSQSSVEPIIETELVKDVNDCTTRVLAAIGVELDNVAVVACVNAAMMLLKASRGLSDAEALDLIIAATADMKRVEMQRTRTFDG